MTSLLSVQAAAGVCVYACEFMMCESESLEISTQSLIWVYVQKSTL